MPVNKSYNNRGIIFSNQYKNEDKHPDFTGKATIGNEEFKVAGWWNYKEGKPPFMSLSFTKDDAIIEDTDSTQKYDKDAGLPDDVDDDLPF